MYVSSIALTASIAAIRQIILSLTGVQEKIKKSSRKDKPARRRFFAGFLDSG
jgi:hypothetical protein